MDIYIVRVGYGIGYGKTRYFVEIFVKIGDLFVENEKVPMAFSKYRHFHLWCISKICKK